MSGGGPKKVKEEQSKHFLQCHSVPFDFALCFLALSVERKEDAVDRK